MELTIYVTARDIKLGQDRTHLTNYGWRSNTCPVARAIRRRTKLKCGVGAASHALVNFYDPNGHNIGTTLLGERVTGFITKADYNDNIKPIKFKLNIPESVESYLRSVS